MVQLTCYGGVGQIGGNQFLLEDGDTRLLFDFGTPFAARGRFYEEYLKPRSAFGLLDPLTMGLLPPLEGLYRPDLEPPAAALWQELRGLPSYRDLRDAPVNGILLSHAHLDHSGYLSFLSKEVPVFARALTAFIAKAVQDSGRTDFESEVTYFIPRVLSESGLLEAGNYRRMPAEQRAYQLFDCDQLSSQAHEFWQTKPGSRGLAPVCLDAAQDIGGLEVRHFPVDHSIPGACAFAVQTSAGWVAYTGDLRLHGHMGHLTRKFVQDLRDLRPVVLLCEGTRAELKQEEKANFTEQEVRERALMEVRQAPGLVIADFGARNIERLLIFADIARQLGRALVLLPKDAYLLKAAHLADPSIPSVMDVADLLVYQEPKVRLDLWEQAILAECGSRLVSPLRIRQHQGQYILCFSFYDLDQLPTIRPQAGSLYLYSSHEAFNEELQLDFRRLRAWIDHFDMRGVGLPLERLDWLVPKGEEGLHASGHADGKSLVELVEEVAPKVLVPIHTTPEGIQYFQKKLRDTGVSIRAPSYGCPVGMDPLEGTN